MLEDCLSVHVLYIFSLFLALWIFWVLLLCMVYGLYNNSYILSSSSMTLWREFQSARLEKALPLTFHEAHQWSLFCSWWTLLSDFSIPHSNELFLKNRERCLVSALKKIFSFTIHKIQSLGAYFIFVLSVFPVLLGFYHFHTGYRPKLLILLSCFATALPLWGGLFTPLSQISFSFHRSPFHSGPLLLFTSSPHPSAWPSFSWFPFITNSVLTRCHC